MMTTSRTARAHADRLIEAAQHLDKAARRLKDRAKQLRQGEWVGPDRCAVSPLEWATSDARTGWLDAERTLTGHECPECHAYVPQAEAPPAVSVYHAEHCRYAYQMPAAGAEKGAMSQTPESGDDCAHSRGRGSMTAGPQRGRQPQGRHRVGAGGAGGAGTQGAPRGD